MFISDRTSQARFKNKTVILKVVPCIGYWWIGTWWFGQLIWFDYNICHFQYIILFNQVHIRRKEITIYPDDNNKPSVGEGLNKKAEVTLDRTWPLDKTTRQPIDESQRLIHMDYAGKLERATAKLGATFLEYRPETGSWVFRVSIAPWYTFVCNVI